MSPRAAIHPRWFLVAAVAISLAAAALRLWHARESLWLDELHTAWCAVGGLDEVAQRAAIGNQSPLFFWVEWLLVRLLGPGELALRLPSLVAGSMLPLALYGIARRYDAGGIGLVAAALMTIDPTAVFYATEARPYALVQLLAAVHIALFAELVSRPKRSIRALWVATAALLFYLHYTAALLIPAELAFYGLAVLICPRQITYRWKAILLDATAIGLLCLPAYGNLAAIYSHRADWNAFVKRSSPWKIFDWWPAALGAAYISAAMVIDHFLPEPRKTAGGQTEGRSLAAGLTLCWLIVPALLAWISTQADVARLFYPRYLVASAPAAMLLAACCVGLAPWRWSKVTVGSLIVTVALWSSGVVELIRDGHFIQSRGEDWRGAIAWLNPQLSRSQYPVLVWSGLIEAGGLAQPHGELLDDYCLLPVTSLYPIAADRADLFPLATNKPGQLAQVAEMLAVHRGGAWLIVRGDELTGGQVAGAVIAGLEKSSTAGVSARWGMKEQRSFGGVQVLLLILDQSDHR